MLKWEFQLKEKYVSKQRFQDKHMANKSTDHENIYVTRTILWPIYNMILKYTQKGNYLLQRMVETKC